MVDKPRKKPTSFDVAALAGVHRSVVSRALSGQGRISEETRAKVIEAAEQLGYRVNFLARGLQNQNSGLVGVVASKLDTPYRARQVKIVARELLREGFNPILIAAEGKDDLSGLISRLLNYNVAGMIVTSDTPPGELIEECARLSVPVTLINRDITVPNADRVQIDIDAAGQLAFDMLASRGATRFAVLDPDLETYSVNGRARSFAQACAAHGHNVTVIRPDEQGYWDGRSVAPQIPPETNGIFATTDLLALGLLDGLRLDCHRQIPAQIQVVGFDDVEQASWGAYDLSTILQDAEIPGIVAVELILARLAEPDRPFSRQTIPLTPIFRGTTQPLP